MSERTTAFGPPTLTITHKGRSFTVRPLITEGVMSDVESRIYERHRKAIRDQREDMSESAYLERLDAVRQQSLRGEFAFEHPTTTAFLKTKEGTVLLLCCMMSCDRADVLELLVERGQELTDILETAMEVSFPDPKPPRPVKKRKR